MSCCRPVKIPQNSSRIRRNSTDRSMQDYLNWPCWIPKMYKRLGCLALFHFLFFVQPCFLISLILWKQSWSEHETVDCTNKIMRISHNHNHKSNANRYAVANVNRYWLGIFRKSSFIQLLIVELWQFNCELWLSVNQSVLLK